MQITFESIDEIRHFILNADITALTRKEPFFGGIGMIITDEMPDTRDWKESFEYSRNSAVYRSDRNDKVIVTPYARELSWLFGQLLHFEQSDINCTELTEFMELSCKSFLMLHKFDDYCAKELLLFVFDLISKVYRERQERARYKHFEEDE